MLKRLYSPSKLLVQDIEFVPGINLIIGEYSHSARTLGSTNGIGKSSVVRLIDYLLLSSGAAKFFSQKKYDFLRDEKHSIYLDLVVNGQVLSIGRDFDKNSKTVRIKRNTDPQYVYELSEASSLLFGIFFPQDIERLLPGNRYGSLINFYVKDDLENFGRKDPIAWITHKGTNKLDLSILNFFLMGMPNDHLISFEAINDKIAKKKNFVNELASKAEASTGKSLAQIRSEIGAREKQLKALQEAFDKFDFLEDYQQVSEKIAALSSRIGASRKQLEQTNRQLSRLKKFAESTSEVDIDELSSQYAQVSGTLGSAIKRSLEDVIAFRESLAEERLKFHAKSMANLELAKSESLGQLTLLESERSILYKVIDETGVAKPLRGAVERIAEERLRLGEIQLIIHQLSEINRDIDVLTVDAGSARRKFNDSLISSEVVVQALQEIFIEVVTDALALHSQIETEQAYLDISRSKTQSGCPVNIETSVPRAEALGNYRLKMAAYDLTVFLHSLDTNLPLPDFLIHDGVFHGISRVSVLRALNYLHRKLSFFEGSQYITTFNREELPRTTDMETGDVKFEFDVDRATILTLQDVPQRMLFKRKI
ncbi:DUF2326 domain-containing protein [Undibacterium sp. Tian12W]|uniref:DUF2326 domain-containing protein n=1 Tax=Undibacterium sp. Tian12W TaxID=3413054 RepID=UPI003BF08F83